MSYSLAGFKRFCASVGLRLEPFQARMLADYFRGATETVIVLPKKNGKTTLLGALALYHLENWKDAECVIVAASRDQAGILYNQAIGLVRDNDLTDVFAVRTGLREIRLQPPEGPRFKMAGPPPAGRIRVLAADASTADGVIPTLALVDELHRHKDGALYGVLRDGLGPMKGRMVTISTAGTRMDSPLGKLREKAHAMPSFKRVGAKNYAREGKFVWWEWCLNPEDDLDSIAKVKTANPASWHSKAALKARRDSPSMTPGQWARFACGVWTEGEEPWIEPSQWDKLAVDIGQLVEGEEVVAAVAVGMNPAYALAARRPDGGVAVKVEVFPGDVVFGELEERLLEIAELYELERLYWGQIAFARSAEILGTDIPVEEAPYRPARLSEASVHLGRMIQERKLRHDGDLTTRAQVMAGQTKKTEEGWRLVPTDDSRGLIALAVAVNGLNVEEDVPMIIVPRSVG